MAKAIVRINAFLDKKQTKDVYNLIYDQVKAGLEVIVVPSYCDVYILNGADIEVQKKEKNDSEIDWEKLAEKYCATCKYCVRAGTCSNPKKCTDFDQWEVKDDA